MTKRRSKPTKHKVITLQGKNAKQRKLPMGLAVDNLENIYMADSHKSVIYKVTAKTHDTEILAGCEIRGGFEDGFRSAAKFSTPKGICWASPVVSSADDDQNLLVCDQYNNAIRKVSPDGQVVTWAGGRGPHSLDGHISVARLCHPQSIVFDPISSATFFTDDGSSGVRRISAQGMVETIFRNQYWPRGLAMDPFGNLMTCIGDDVYTIYKPNAPISPYKILKSGLVGCHDIVADKRGMVFVLRYHDGGTIYISRLTEIDYGPKVTKAISTMSSLAFPRDLVSLIVSFLPDLVTVKDLSIDVAHPYFRSFCISGKELLVAGGPIDDRLLRLTI